MHRTRRTDWLLTLVLVLFAAGMAGLADIRPIDGDEGYYASAARLVAEGGRPYLDFFYPQMPYLPYVYAPFYELVGSSLVAMRGLSVLAGVLTLALWGLLLRGRFPDRPLFVVGGMLLMALNPHLLSWTVTIKTFALANLGVMAALWALDRGLAGRRWGWFVAAGLAMGFTVGVRLLYLPWAVALLVALAWLCWRRPALGVTPASVAAAAGGLLLGLAPALRLVLADPERFRFNNLDYHRLRFNPLDRMAEAAGEAGRAGSDLPHAVDAVLELGRAVLLNPSMLVLVGLAVMGVLAIRRPGPRDQAGAALHPLAVLAGWGAVIHTAACLLPDPPHAQYFTAPLVPLLAPLALLGVIDLLGVTDPARRFGRPTFVAGGAGAVLVVLCVVGLQVRHVGMDWSEVWDTGHLAEVTANIESRTAPDDMVLAFWSGYVFESGRRFVPGMENHFALGVSERLPLDRKVAYHVAGKELLLKAILTKAPKVVVLGAWMHEVNTTLEQEDLPLILQELDANYEIAWMKGEVKILVRRPGPGLKL